MTARTSPPKVGAHEIRRRFVDFFKERGHSHVASSPLVPQDDPSLLFVNAGMVQFKDVFLGRETRDYSRAVSSQKVVRAGGKHNDLDNVGFTPRHHTFFEMLGNFSFGDYFKAEAIEWGWAFLTEVLAIPKERLCVSVFSGEGESAPFDEEAYELWTKYLPKDRIYRFNAKENFWQMGDTGPCGPCSEIHIFKGDTAPGDALLPGDHGPAFEDDRYVELWNLVFMQYEKQANGELITLPKPSIDTGAGLERVAAVMAGVDNNFATELLSPFVDLTKRLAGVSGHQGELESAFQVVADHARATAFLIADGVFPEKTTREYVLRRIMRRAIRYGNKVGLDRPFFHTVCDEVVQQFSEVFPELNTARSTIQEVVQGEEELFRNTLSRGLKLFDSEYGRLPEGSEEFPAKVAATLYDTYGFPIDLSRILATERGVRLDEAEAHKRVKEMQGGPQKGGAGDKGIADLYFELAEDFANKSEFSGYTESEVSTEVLAIVGAGRRSDSLVTGEQGEIVLARTPFYAESGGQIGDAGRLSWADGEGSIIDTQKPAGGLHIHRVKIERGELKVGQQLKVVVDGERRAAIARNHSATHLLHHALRAVLGDHVVQKGSHVGPDRLRFDFSHRKPVTPDELRAVERVVCEHVVANAGSSVREMALDAAKAAGAIGLFGEKYGDSVRVVGIGPESVELCGGIHVERSGDIGPVAIVAETGIAQGVRRIEALSGPVALAHHQAMVELVHATAAHIHAQPDELSDRVEKMAKDLKSRGLEIQQLEAKLATASAGGGGGDDTIEVRGIRVLAKDVGEAEPKVMRAAADTLRDKLKSGVVVLGARRGAKANLLVAVTGDLTDRVQAGRLVAALAQKVDGRGGGKPELAQAGGPKVDGLPAALASVQAELEQLLDGQAG